MRKQGNIVRAAMDEIKAMIARDGDRTDWARVDATTAEEIEAQAAEDEEEKDSPKRWEKEATIMSLPPAKQPVNLRLDADVLEWFKRSGKGYQTRMNNVLRAFMKASEGRVHVRKPD